MQINRKALHKKTTILCKYHKIVALSLIVILDYIFRFSNNVGSMFCEEIYAFARCQSNFYVYTQVASCSFWPNRICSFTFVKWHWINFFLPKW